MKMEIITTVSEMKKSINRERDAKKNLGFVPTMGYLHEGHLSLIRRAREENDVVVVSIFVNPTQFGINEDFDLYPRNLAKDSSLAEEAGAAYLFCPEVKEMYPSGYETFIEVTEMTQGLCGASRPSHFRGVTTVVNKLFQIVKPHRAYFGLKDAQQVMVIQKMVQDLNMDVEIVPCPIIREADGLAMSSRNVNLSNGERSAALVLFRSLAVAKEMLLAGEQEARRLKGAILKIIEKEPLVKLDYVEIVNFEKLTPIEQLRDKSLIALAAKVGKVRLIDNLYWEGQ